MADNKKYIGEGKLPQEPNKKLTLKLKDGSVTTNKIADGAVTGAKLGTDVKNILNNIQGGMVRGISINGGNPKFPQRQGIINLVLDTGGGNIDETLVNQIEQNANNISNLFDLIDGVATNDSHKVKFIEYWQADTPDAYTSDLLWYKLEDTEEGATEINLYVSVVSIVGNPPVFDWVRADSLEDSDKYIDFSAIYVNKSNSTLYRINDDANGMEPLMWDATGKIVSIDFWSDVPPHTSELEADTEYWWYCPMLKILYHICDNITKPVSEGLYIMKDSSSGDLYILDAANQRCVEFSGKITVDNSFVYDSTNPVESKVIKAALDTKADKLQVGDAITPVGWDTIPEDYDVGSYRKMGDLLYYYDGDGWNIELSPKLVQHNGSFYFYTRAGGFKKTSDSESSAAILNVKYWKEKPDEGNVLDGELLLTNGYELKVWRDGEFQSFASHNDIFLVCHNDEFYIVTQGESADKIEHDLQEVGMFNNGYMSSWQYRNLVEAFGLRGQAIPVTYWMPEETPQENLRGIYWLGDDLFLYRSTGNSNNPWEELPDAGADQRVLVFDNVNSLLYVLVPGEELTLVGTGGGNQTIDNVPIEGSNHPISSDAVFNILSELNEIKGVLYGTTDDAVSGTFPPPNPSIGDTYRNSTDGRIYVCTALGTPAQIKLKVQTAIVESSGKEVMNTVGEMANVSVENMNFNFAEGEQVKFVKIADRNNTSWGMYKYYNLESQSGLTITQHLMRRLVVALVKSGYNPILDDDNILREDVLDNNYLVSRNGTAPSIGNKFFGYLYDGTEATSAGRSTIGLEKEIDNYELVVSSRVVGNTVVVTHAEYASGLIDDEDKLIPGAFLIEYDGTEDLAKDDRYEAHPYYVTINTKYACGDRDFVVSTKALKNVPTNIFSIVNGDPVSYIPNTQGMLRVVDFIPGTPNTWEEVTDGGLISRVQYLELYGGGGEGSGDGGSLPTSLATLIKRVEDAAGNLESLYSQVATQAYVTDVLDQNRTKTTVCTSADSLPSDALDGEMRLLVENDEPKGVWCYGHTWYYADGTEVTSD